MYVKDGPIRVLHVDDDREFVETAAVFLEREDERFDVETATDSTAGLERLATGAVDCIVSDYDMPGEDGIEFLERVRENHPDLPFVLYTGKGSEAIASEAVSAGVTDYLQKGGGTSQYTVLANRIRNVVEKHDAQTELADREKRLSLFFEQSPLGVVEWDEGFRFVRQNDAAEAILGYSEDELIGRSWRKIVPASELDPIDTVVSDLLENAGGFHSVNENVRKDGERIVCEWHNRVVTDETGGVVAIFSQFQDVTDRKARQRELEQYEAYLQGSTDIITVLDDAGRLRYQSPSVTRVLGYDPGELIGEDGFRYIHPDDGAATADAFQTLIAGSREHVSQEFRFQTATGEWRWLESRGTDYLDSPEIDGIVVNSRDITTRKQREQQLEEFASVVSHDLRNPLNVAQTRLELARQECESDHLGGVERAHSRIAALIDDLLTLARNGDRVGDVEVIALDTLTERCWQTVDTADATLQADTDLRLEADRKRLRQLLENLVRNAIEHADRDVTIGLGALPDGFYVADDGPGIPEDRREAVFDAGFSTADGGTGFGLNIVDQIASAHGWEVTLATARDGGTRVEITGVTTVG